jgi:predicted nucleotidyltransferase
MTRQELLAEIRARLEKAHGKRLRGIVLYGSEARGEAGPDSDIDLLVLLDGPVHYYRDLMANMDALYPLAVEVQRRISPKPVDVVEYERARWPLYQNARREGIVV